MLVADYGVPIGESTCIRCGTCLQVCPTGAFIDRHSAYIGKETNSDKINSVCVGCSIGCNVELLVRDNQLIRIDGNWSSPLNGGLLCEIGHFNALEFPLPRLQNPLVRKNGTLEPASWDEALAVVAEHLKPLAGKNGSGVAALASTRLPAESLYTFKSLFKDGLGSGMVTSSEENATFAVQRLVKNGALSLNGSLENLKNADVVVAVGVDLVTDHQVAGFFVKRNLPYGTRLIVIDSAETKMTDIASLALLCQSASTSALLLGLAAEINRQGTAKGSFDLEVDLSTYDLAAVSRMTGLDGNTIQKASAIIASAENPAFVFGKGITQCGNPEILEALSLLAGLAGSTELISPKGNANSMAALRYGLDSEFKPQGHAAVYLALGDEIPKQGLAEKLEGVPFLAVQACLVSPVTEKADVVLPVTTWMEQDGHYMNMEGLIQSVCQAVQPADGIWSNLAVLEALSTKIDYHPREGWLKELDGTAA
jgi:formate dehydrogenase major subunit